MGAFILQTNIADKTVFCAGAGRDFFQLRFAGTGLQHQTGNVGVVSHDVGDPTQAGQGDAHEFTGPEHNVISGEGGIVIGQCTRRVDDLLYRIALVQDGGTVIRPD